MPSVDEKELGERHLGYQPVRNAPPFGKSVPQGGDRGTATGKAETCLPDATSDVQDPEPTELPPQKIAQEVIFGNAWMIEVVEIPAAAKNTFGFGGGVEVFSLPVGSLVSEIQTDPALEKRGSDKWLSSKTAMYSPTSPKSIRIMPPMPVFTIRCWREAPGGYYERIAAYACAT